MTNKNHQSVLWLLVGLSAILSFVSSMPFAIAYAGSFSMVAISARLLFAFLHGSQRMGWRRLGVLFVICCVVSWCYESLSIATGFPFGHYVYTPELGLKLGTVPLMIMPSYFGVCYLAWVLSHIVLDKLDRQINSSLIFAVPIIASFIMVMWDMSIDPASSTIKHEWIWRDGGGYFGVPFSNFMGWFLCVYTIFQLWAIYLVRSKDANQCPADQYKSSWYLVITIYASIFTGPIAAVFVNNGGTITDASSQVWPVQALYETLGLVSIFTMLFVICLAFFKIQKNDSLQ